MWRTRARGQERRKGGVAAPNIRYDSRGSTDPATTHPAVQTDASLILPAGNTGYASVATIHRGGWRAKQRPPHRSGDAGRGGVPSGDGLNLSGRLRSLTGGLVM